MYRPVGVMKTLLSIVDEGTRHRILDRYRTDFQIGHPVFNLLSATEADNRLSSPTLAILLPVFTVAFQDVAIGDFDAMCR